ncbi:MAG: LamG domain-containing protein [Polyangia bacterium]
MNRFSAVSLFLVAALSLLSAGCPAAPEQCPGCLPARADGGGLRTADGPASDRGGSGGGAGSGLIVGTGGSGGLDTGGAGGTITGGMAGTGATGGISATGGHATGGAGTGGAGTGGAATGGAGTGGAATGGQGTGGQGTGGAQGGMGGGNGGGTVATGGQGGGGGRGGAGGATDPDLVLWYRFDESSGNTAADSSIADGAPRNGTLATMGSGAIATWSALPRVGSHAVSLRPAATMPNSNGAYVTVPASIQTLAPGAVTIALWVNLAAATVTQNWERIFDFGSGPDAMGNVNLTARAGDPANTPLRFVITNGGHAGASEQRLERPGAPWTANAWHHIAVVLPVGSPYTGTLYVDGTAVATNPAMTVHPGGLGATTNNWLGRSQFMNDPYFSGLMDDFRIYRRALSGTEITGLFTAR